MKTRKSLSLCSSVVVRPRSVRFDYEDENEGRGRFERAFTLIELLVVISIIAILAGLLIPAGLAVKNRTTINRVQGELAQIEMAIERYKTDKGFYPPDNSAVTGQLLEDLYSNGDTTAWTNSLYYELIGVSIDEEDEDVYVTTAGERVLIEDVTGRFGVGGVLNADVGSGGGAKNYLADLRPNQHANVGDVEVLGTSVGGEFMVGSIDDRVAPFRYVASNPAHNSETFDLWVDVVVGGKHLRISNWRNDPEVIPFE